MELQEFISAVENLLGAKCVQENELNYDISNDRLSVGIRQQFLGGVDVFLCYPGAGVIQPTGENLADSFRRVQQAHERVNADWSLYQEQADQALKEFKSWVKIPLEYTPVICDNLPGYYAKHPGIDVVLFHITCSGEGDFLVNHRVLKMVTRSHKATPGRYAIECREVDGKKFLRHGSDCKAILFGCAACENAKVSMREFEIMPEVLSHTTTDEDNLEMPDIEIYEGLTRRHEYTFIEFEVK
jgi:hypothetical protein